MEKQRGVSDGEAEPPVGGITISREQRMTESPHIDPLVTTRAEGDIELAAAETKEIPVEASLQSTAARQLRVHPCKPLGIVPADASQSSPPGVEDCRRFVGDCDRPSGCEMGISRSK